MEYLEITAAGTYTLKHGAGYLQGITVNLPGSTPTLRIFDQTSAAAPGIAGGAKAFAIPAAGTYLRYDCHFTNGLTIVIAGTSDQSYTVSYY